jgi:hypothetical protein
VEIRNEGKFPRWWTQLRGDPVDDVRFQEGRKHGIHNAKDIIAWIEQQLPVEEEH